METCKKIVLITTGQPSVNPRIVKEADALVKLGYDVTVIYCFFIQWAVTTDAVLLKKVLWKYKMVGGNPTDNKFIYYFTKIRFKVANFINRLIQNYFLIAERAQARAYDELLYTAKKIKADWYIGHNLGALSIAVKAAEYNNAKAGFDFEDYHRGEGHDKNTLTRIIFLENKYISSLEYISTASEMITAITNKNHFSFKGKVITLLNCFPLNQQPSLKNNNNLEKQLKLFWFSQTVGLNRGLECLINCVNILNDSSIHITLAGRCDDETINYIKNNAGKQKNNIHFAGVIQPELIPEFSSNFDVGLALETAFSINNDFALSNKIFTYLLAGNAMILSETTEQKEFNNKYHVGETFPINNVEVLKKKILAFKNDEKLNVQKQYNYNLAINELNWENESKKLAEVIK